MAAKETIILGIDPGTSVMGYGLIKVAQGKMSIIHLGVLKLGKVAGHELKLKMIFDCVVRIIDQYHPDELSIEAPFYGKNVQSMLKLGRAQGVAIAAALSREIPYTEYSPKKIKQSVTGSGNASKEQVAAMLKNVLQLKTLPKEMDATDGLAAAVTHYYQMGKPQSTASGAKGWAAFVTQNKDRIV